MNKVAKKEENLPAVGNVLDFEAYAGEGLSAVKAEDLAIPFLRILADLSKQVKKIEAAYIQGAEPGMIMNTALNEVYDGKEGISVIPCYYQRRVIQWKPNRGGFMGSHEADTPLLKSAKRNAKNADELPDGSNLENTAHFFVLLLHPTMGAQKALITMSKTQMKKSKKWLSQISSRQGQRQDGTSFTMPMMSQVYRLKTVAERNDQGSWFGWEISHERQLNLSEPVDGNLFGMAIEFGKSVKAGEVTVKHELEDGGDDREWNNDKEIM